VADWQPVAREQSGPEQCPEGGAVAEGAATTLAAVRGTAWASGGRWLLGSVRGLG
jgi:hypothetical protein